MTQKNIRRKYSSRFFTIALTHAIFGIGITMIGMLTHAPTVRDLGFLIVATTPITTFIVAYWMMKQMEREITEIRKLSE